MNGTEAKTISANCQPKKIAQLVLNIPENINERIIDKFSLIPDSNFLKSFEILDANSPGF